MSEYKLEMGDSTAEILALVLDDCSTDGSITREAQLAASTAASTIRAQIPIPVPTKVGAVVRTEGGFRGGTYLRWAHDNATTSPWIETGNHEEPHRTDQIGRITAVLSEGVDL